MSEGHGSAAAAEFAELAGFDAAGETEIIVVDLMPRRAALTRVEQRHLSIEPCQKQRGGESGRPRADDKRFKFSLCHVLHTPCTTAQLSE